MITSLCTVCTNAYLTAVLCVLDTAVMIGTAGWTVAVCMPRGLHGSISGGMQS
jgi:hypothetical protein